MLGPVELVDEVDSTNRVLLDRARQGAPHGLVLVADHQTAGRGRLDRRWEAAPGAALLVSVLLRPIWPAGQHHLVTAAAGLAAVEAVGATAGVTVGLKWPNDVISPDGRKLAGILAETIVEGTEIAAVVVGMGMNVAVGPLPPGAVAVGELAGRTVDRHVLLKTWLERFSALLDELDGDAIITLYRQCCWTIGAQVRVNRPEGALEGLASDVDADGRLLVEAGGSTVLVSVGDVTHVRHVSAS